MSALRRRKKGLLRRLLRGSLGGAVLSYLFDPQMGRARRAKLAAMATSQIRALRRRTSGEAKHLRNRAEGFVHETLSKREEASVPDGTRPL